MTAVDYEANGGNPYRQVFLKVEYTNTANPAEKYSTYGFWDGRNPSNQNQHMFKIRAAFGYGTGPWSWRVTSCQKLNSSEALVGCGDASLENACGTINVLGVSIGDQSPLYDHGFLKQPTSPMRHLVHHDGTPFFWLGDTAWFASVAARTTDWEAYVTQRGQVNQASPPQNFSLVQVAPSPHNVPLAAGVPGPFTQVAGCTGGSWKIPDKCSKWEPAYWRQLDDKVRLANGFGMVVLFAGVMDPMNRVTAASLPETADARTFARNLAARMFGSFVIFSPGFDHQTSDSRVRNLAIAVGNELKAATARHLVTYHPGGEAGTNPAMDEAPYPRHLHDQNRSAGGWLSFDMVHSGHVAPESDPQKKLRRVLYRARVFPQRLAYDSTFTGNVIIPVVNGEAAYDKGPAATSTDDVGHTYRARQYGYATMLSGAYGYTFGAAHLWNWSSSWNLPLTWPSAAEMGHLQNIFRTVTWYRLMGNATAQSRVENQIPDPTDPTGVQEKNRMVVAYEANTALVAYVPAGNAQIELYLADVVGFPSSFSKTWYSPRTGAARPASPTSLPAGGGKRARYSFTKPACDGSCSTGTNDWVLVLKKTSALTATNALSKETMRLWPAPDAETGGSYVVYAPEASGGTLGPAARVSSGRRQFQSFPEVAATPDGGYVIVWQSRGEDNVGEDVWVRRFHPSRKPVGDEVRVNGTIDGDQMLPSVSVAASGDFVVVWSGRDAEGVGSDVFARRFHGSGHPAGSEFRVNSTMAGEQSFPRVASAPDGGFVVAWESEEADGSTAILARRFDVSGRPVGEETHASGAGLLRLADVEVLPSGEARVLGTKLTPQGESSGLLAWRFRPFRPSDR